VTGESVDVWPDEDLVMVSAISHWCYCPRRCALIHLENVFEENVFTLRGRREHENVDQAGHETAEGVVIQLALPLRSNRLGLTGVADVVEFWPDGQVLPVEYKHGRRRKGGRLNDMAQLCAQAMCLEEMLGVSITRAALFYRGSKRRQEVPLDGGLRSCTEAAVTRIREMLKSGVTPPPVNDKRCPDCSLKDCCQPELVEALARDGPASALFVPGEGEGLD